MDVFFWSLFQSLIRLQNLKAYTQIAELDSLFCMNFEAARTFYIGNLKKKQLSIPNHYSKYLHMIYLYSIREFLLL